MTKISVLMPVFNTEESWLRASVESILKQSFSDFEYIIVLDGPTDGSDVVVKEYAEKDSRIRIIENESNIGIVESLNRGLQEAKSEYIARMDSDDIAYPDRFEKQLKHIEEEKLGITGSGIRFIDENGRHIPETSVIIDSETLPKVLKHANCVMHPTWMIRKDVYDKLKGYRNIKFCEDYDFLLRAVKAGIKMDVQADVLLEYRVSPEGISKSNAYAQYLSARYLRHNQSGLEDLNQEEIDEYLAKRVSPSNTEKFARAQLLIDGSMDLIKRRKKAKAAARIIKAFMIYPKISLYVNDIAKAVAVRDKT